MTRIGSTETKNVPITQGKEENDGLGLRKGVFAKLKRFWHFVYLGIGGFKFVLMDWFTKRRKFDFSEAEKYGEKNLVITGGFGGIGIEVVKQCLQHNMHVIVGSRNPKDGDSFIKKLRAEGVTSGTVEYFLLDHNSLESVKAFAQFVLFKNIPIHVLINNAEVMFPPFHMTQDGFESQFQTNYISHFFLTVLLQPALEMGGMPHSPSRVVNVSSVAHYGGRVDFDNIDMRYDYSPAMAYMNSKLMMTISGNHFNRKLEESESIIQFFSVHPGTVTTSLFRNDSGIYFFGRFMSCLFQTAEQGADGIMFVAFSPDLRHEGTSNKFYYNCKGYLPHPLALDHQVQDTLYKFSMELCGMNKVEAVSLNNFA